MGTYVITGSSSGIGAAVRVRLEAAGHAVIGVDLDGAEISANLATPDGRQQAVQDILAQTDTVDGLVPCAGIAGLPHRTGGPLISLNYFGTMEIVEGLRDALAAAEAPAVVLIASNSMTLQNPIDEELVVACLANDEQAAVARAEEIGSLSTYPAGKAALTRWIRTVGMGAQWTGSGIRLNAVAPGVTETPMVAETRADETIGHFFEKIPIPAGPTGEPDQIASVIEFLLGPDASYVHGTVLFIDGGTDALLAPNRH